VIHLVKRVLPVTLQILERVLGQFLVKFVLLAPPPILEQILEQQLVHVVCLAYIHYFPTLRRVRPVPPLPTPPLSNAPLLSTKKLQPVTQDIMETRVIHRVKGVMPVPLQILEQRLGR
jgi:hypothetical protein